MYEMPMIFVIVVLRFGRAIFVLGFWVLAFCHWCFVPRSLSIGKMLFPQVTTRSLSHHLSCHIQVHCYSTFYQGLQVFDITQISVTIIIVLWMLSWAMDDSTNVGSPSSTMKEVIKFVIKDDNYKGVSTACLTSNEEFSSTFSIKTDAIGHQPSFSSPLSIGLLLLRKS